MDIGFLGRWPQRLLRAMLIILGLLLPFNFPVSIPSMEVKKRFGWSVSPPDDHYDSAHLKLQQVIRHGYTHGALSGDILISLEGIRADSLWVEEVRETATVGDTIRLTVERDGRQLDLFIPVESSSLAYAGYFWYRMVVAVAAWLVGMALIAWRGGERASLVLGAALILLAPITASAGVPGDHAFYRVIRWGWQIQAAAFPIFMPALLLHFILQHRTPRRSLGIDLWGPTYLALVITLAFTTRNFREPMAWAEFGPIREFTSTVTLTLNVLVALVATRFLLRRSARPAGPTLWVTFAALLVTGSNAILSGARLALGDPHVSELLWRLNGSTLLLLPATGALYLIYPGDGRWPFVTYKWRTTTLISILLTGLFGLSVAGVAGVLLSVSGSDHSGEEWALLLGVFLAAVTFSPVLRWSEELAGQHIHAHWRVLEDRAQKFVATIGLQLEQSAIIDLIEDELPEILELPSVDISLTEGKSTRHDSEDVGGTIIPIQSPDRGTVGYLRLGAVVGPGSPQRAVLGNIVNGIAMALHNAETHSRLRDAELEVAESKRIASLGALAGGLAHEIKNPLAALKMGIYLLEQNGLDSVRVQRIQRDLQRIDDLISGLLRFTHDRVTEEPTTLEVAQFVRANIEDLRPIASDREIQVHLESADEGLYVRASPSQLRVLVSNLLRNALDAAGHGGEVHLRLERRDHEMFLLVGDSGPGIPAGLEERIFELAYSTRPGGSGLGLALARREAENLGGRIDVLREADVGTTLQIVLPLAI